MIKEYKRQKARERYASMPTEKKTELNAKKGKTIIVEKPKDNQPMQLCKHLVLLCAMHCSCVFFMSQQFNSLHMTGASSIMAPTNTVGLSVR